MKDYKCIASNTIDGTLYTSNTNGGTSYTVHRLSVAKKVTQRNGVTLTCRAKEKPGPYVYKLDT